MHVCIFWNETHQLHMIVICLLNKGYSNTYTQECVCSVCTPFGFYYVLCFDILYVVFCFTFSNNTMGSDAHLDIILAGYLLHNNEIFIFSIFFLFDSFKSNTFRFDFRCQNKKHFPVLSTFRGRKKQPEIQLLLFTAWIRFPLVKKFQSDALYFLIHFFSLFSFNRTRKKPKRTKMLRWKKAFSHLSLGSHTYLLAIIVSFTWIIIFSDLRFRWIRNGL